MTKIKNNKRKIKIMMKINLMDKLRNQIKAKRIQMNQET